MTKVENGLLAGRVPYLCGGSGPRTACVFFGVNALFRRLDQTPDPRRYLRQISRRLPQHRVWGSFERDTVPKRLFAVDTASSKDLSMSYLDTDVNWR